MVVKIVTISWIDTGLRGNGSEQSIAVNVAGHSLLLVYGDESWWAVEDRCSHSACSFSSDGEAVGLTVVCDCHGSEFDVRTGAVMMPPADEPIASYPVRVSEGRIEVDI